MKKLREIAGCGIGVVGIGIALVGVVLMDVGMTIGDETHEPWEFTRNLVKELED